MKRVLLFATAIALVATPTAGAAKAKPVKHQGALGISAEPAAGEAWVPNAGVPFTASYERRKGSRTKMKRVLSVVFEELVITCSDGPGFRAKDVGIGGFAVSKKRQTFSYKGKADSAFTTLGVSDASTFSFRFSGRLLDKGRRAEGTLRTSFTSTSQGSCDSFSQTWRSGT